MYFRAVKNVATVIFSPGSVVASEARGFNPTLFTEAEKGSRRALVSGHDFSSAAKKRRHMQALAPVQQRLKPLF
jgi:hypothetical protein